MQNKEIRLSVISLRSEGILSSPHILEFQLYTTYASASQQLYTFFFLIEPRHKIIPDLTLPSFPLISSLCSFAFSENTAPGGKIKML